MATPLPNHPQLRGNYAPINFEADCHDLVVEGRVPEDLAGSLYRIGPNPKFVPNEGYHWFFGAGMVHAFHFAGGRVDYLNRWARTPKFEAEQAAGRPLPMSFVSDPVTGAIQSDRRNGLANTHIVWHGNQLLALEEGSHPFSMTPETLESVGYGHYASDLQDAMTAHPKIDPLTGDLHGFGYMSGAIGSNKMTYHVVSPNGVVRRSDSFEAPYAAMVHDFVVTRDYVLFPLFPLTFDLDRMSSLGSPFAFDAEAGAFIGILERDAPVSEIRWIEAPVCFVFHYLNAWNDGTQITFDAIDFQVAPIFRTPKATCPVMQKRRASSRGGECTWVRERLIASRSSITRPNFRESMIGLQWIDTATGSSPPRRSASAGTVVCSMRSRTSISTRASNKSGTLASGREFPSQFSFLSPSVKTRVMVGCWQPFMNPSAGPRH